MSEKIIEVQELTEITAKKLIAAGFRPADANTVADVLVYADKRGVHSHGVMRVEHYCTRLAKGGLNPVPHITIEEKTPVISIVDSDDGMGHVACKIATKHGISVAKKFGMAMVVVKRTSHCGALAYYAEMAAREDIISIGMTQTDKCVVPFGGAEPFFGTNPIAFSFPSDADNPVVGDMATSNVAFGKILYSKEKNLPIPNDWAVDKDGNPITDPNEFSALLPFGGAKGYCIGLAIDALTGVLMNAQFGPHIHQMYGEYDKMRDLVSTFIFINPEFFGGTTSYKKLMKQMSDELHQSKPRKGNKQVLLPGEPEFINAKESESKGVRIPESVYEYLISDMI